MDAHACVACFGIPLRCIIANCLWLRRRIMTLLLPRPTAGGVLPTKSAACLVSFPCWMSLAVAHCLVCADEHHRYTSTALTTQA